jgi:hypothetical protein
VRFEVRGTRGAGLVARAGRWIGCRDRSWASSRPTSETLDDNDNDNDNDNENDNDNDNDNENDNDVRELPLGLSSPTGGHAWHANPPAESAPSGSRADVAYARISRTLIGKE